MDRALVWLVAGLALLLPHGVAAQSANPDVLQGVRGIAVRIDMIDAALAGIGFSRAFLETAVEERLRENGVDVLDLATSRYGPELHVSVRALKPQASPFVRPSSCLSARSPKRESPSTPSQRVWWSSSLASNCTGLRRGKLGFSRAHLVLVRRTSSETGFSNLSNNSAMTFGR